MTSTAERKETATPFASVNGDGVKVSLSSLSVEQLNERRNELETVFAKAYEEAGPNVDYSKITAIGGEDSEKRGKLKEMHTEIAAIVDEISSKEKLKAWKRDIDNRNFKPSETAQTRHGDQDGDEAEPFNVMSFANHVFGERGGKVYNQRVEQVMNAFGNSSITMNGEVTKWDDDTVGLPIDILNTLFQRGTGAGQAEAPINVPRPNYFVGGVTPPPDLLDVIQQFAWNQGSYTFYRESNRSIAQVIGNDAAPKSEGDRMTEGAQQLTKITIPMEVVAGYLPVTDELLEDIVGLMNWVSQRVGYRVRQALNYQLMLGNSTGPNLIGLLSTTAATGLRLPVTQAAVTGTGAATALTDVYRSLGQVITDARSNGYESPDLVIVNPSVWFAAVSEAAGAADKAFIVNQPPSQDGIMFRCWGRPVVENNDLSMDDAADPGNTVAVVGKFSDNVGIFVRRQLQTTWGFINDDFIRGRNACKATIRCLLAVEQPGYLRKLNFTTGS